jgi:hypothetical protein
MAVSRPWVIDVDADLSEVLRTSTAPVTSFGRTPLSFVNRREWFMSQFWAYYTQAVRNALFLPPRSQKPTEADHFPSIEFPETDIKWELMLCWMIPTYSAIFMAAWNFSFPTSTEHLLWKIAAIACLAYGFLGSLVASSWQHRSLLKSWYDAIRRILGMKKQEHVQELREQESQDKPTTVTLPVSSPKLTAPLRRINQSFHWMRNLSPDDDPMMAIPVRLWIPTTTLCTIYCISRAFILVEDFIALRSLPQSAFQEVDWSQYSPIL